MRKGISILHILAFIIILLLVGLGYVFHLAFSDVKTFEKGIREATVIEGINTMELLRKNLEQALTYSYYQASFEVAKNGGYDKPNLRIWRNYNDLSGFPINFEKTLADRTVEILNQYRTALTDAGMTTVDYTQVTAVENKCTTMSIACTDFKKQDDCKVQTNCEWADNKCKPILVPFACEQLNKDESTCIAQTNCKWIEKSDKEYISALSKDKDNKDQEIKVSKSAFYEVFNKANVFVLIPIRTLKLFETATSNFANPSNDLLKNKIAQGIVSANLPSTGSTSDCGSPPTALQVFQATAHKTKKQTESLITDSVDVSLSSIESELSKDKISVKLPQTNRQIESLVELDESKCTTRASALHSGDENLDCQGTVYTKTCSFNYFSSAKVLVTITDDGNMYPVYDSTVDMRNIQLNFNVVSGNDYSRKLI